MSADTIRTTASGYEYVVVHFYSSGEAKANIVRFYLQARARRPLAD